MMRASVEPMRSAFIQSRPHPTNKPVAVRTSWDLGTCPFSRKSCLRLPVGSSVFSCAASSDTAYPPPTSTMMEGIRSIAVRTMVLCSRNKKGSSA